LSVAFKPDRYGVVVTNKWTSNSGRWVVFLGQHYDGKTYCHDVGCFRTTDGVVQRLHFKEDKTMALIQYDETRARLKEIKERHESDEKEIHHILGPSGKPAHQD
jgi:predicted Fe-S protein YdhL (DUF1289 family)